MGIFLWLFPKECVGCGKGGKWLCDVCKLKLKPAKLKCGECGRASMGGFTHARCKRGWGLERVTMIYAYEGLMKRIVRQIKYRFCRELLEEVLEGVEVDFTKDFVVVPVPLYVRRENWRGFNQARMLGEWLVVRGGFGIADCLKRRRATRPLAEMGEKERKMEIQGVFEFVGDFVPKKVVLVDDVFTSGVTMKEAAKVLKRRGVKEVWGWVLAG